MRTTPHQAPPPLVARDSRSRALSRAWRVLIAAILLLLLAQFLVGMVVNLYVQIPSAHPGTRGATPFSEDVPQIEQGLGWALAHGDLNLRIHVVLGLLLGLTALLIIGLAIATRRRARVLISVAGALTIAGASINGVAFLNAGGQALNSLAMSVNFLLALVIYAVTLYRTR